MLILNIGAVETWDPFKEQLKITGGKVYSLENSLWAMAQWETKYKKPMPLLNGKELTGQEYVDYILFMSLDELVPVNKLEQKHIDAINEYLQGEHTATIINSKDPKGNKGNFVTTEVLYATMCQAQIPWEAEKWNISRLFKLIGVIAERSKERKPMNKNAILKQNAELNRIRREQLKTKG